MPSELEIILRNVRIPVKVWYKLIEAKVADIKPDLDAHTLLTFGETDFFRQEGEPAPLRECLSGKCRLEIIGEPDPGDILNLQGLYWAPPKGLVFSSDPAPSSLAIFNEYPDGKRLIYGLTRKGNWILIEVQFRGTRGRRLGSQYAESIQAGFTDAREICVRLEISPEEIWSKLNRQIIKWDEARLEQYQRIQKRGDQARLLETIVGCIKH
jgi:hypothetical protein